MAISLRSDFHTDLAEQVLFDIFYQRSNYYYFLGKVEPWGTADVAPLIVQTDSDLEDTTIRNNMVFIKKVSPSDVSLVTNRYNWRTGVVYPHWDHSTDMSSAAFYVMTDDFNVYKCLDNYGGAQSIVKPTGRSFYPFRTSDGYLWKYMYNIPSFKRTKFNSLNYIPVQKALTDSFYNNGSIEDVAISSGGSGYSDALLTTITVANNTVTGSGAQVSIASVGTLGQITGFTIINGGSNYTAGATIKISSATGFNFVGTVNVTNGVITSITINDAGFGYTTSNNVSISVGGAVLVPVVSRATGSIVDIRIVDAGSGYATAPTLTVGVVSGETPGTGLYNNHTTAIVKAIVNEGKIVRVTIEDPGVDYPADTSTTVVVQGDGEDAAFTPVIYNGELVDVIVDNPGSGYTYIILTIVGTGEGAEVTGIVQASDYESDQALVEQTAVPGAIYCVKVTEQGTNYSINTTITIQGDGTGAAATPVIELGKITHIIVNTYGSNYTYANVIINDPERPLIGDFIDATAYAVLSPLGGHGFNAPSEFNADKLSICSFIRKEPILTVLNQDYRQYGIIKNLTNIATNKQITSSGLSIVYKVEFDDVADLVIDEILIQNNIKFRVLQVENNIVTLQQLGSLYINLTGILTAETDALRSYNVVTVSSFPTVNKYSGKLLYVSDEDPFAFTETQGITIKTFIRF